MTPGTANARELIDRIRARLPDEHEHVREVRMFGTIAVMIDDAMAVAVHNDGGLLVRVAPDEDSRLLESPGASRAEMGTGRSMGTGWIHVEARVLADDAALDGWLECATRNLAQRGSARG
ncbi:TfoX/Sxy family protein [Agromyces laixinhei]|uniref:TfoX/Sxy family protein n=1 Tax=Agromyces laixinhei TaxID=2585717 RepID=UPI0012ED9B4D|nr:TfoX/Sxy family protein [Agromyces laixinhei]